jgi:hypothetical protein
VRSTYVAGDAIIENGNFEVSTSLLPPPGYAIYANTPTLAYDTSTQFSGTQSIKITSSGIGGGGIRPIKQIMCRPGDVFFASVRAKCISGAGTANVDVSFRDAAGNGVGGGGATSPTGSWVLLTTTQTAPAGTVFATFEIYASIANTVVEFDEHYVRCVRNLDNEVADGSTYRRPVAVNTNHLLGSAGQVPIGSNGFPKSSTSAILTSSAGSHTVSVASFSVQYGFGSVTYSSGSVSTGASFGQFLIYFSDPTYAGGAVTYLSVATSSASAVSAAYANDGYQVIGVITTASGSGGGGGGGFGDGCFSINTKLRTQRGDVPFAELCTNEDYILTARGTWKPIEFLTVRHYKGLMCDMGEGELSTLGHRTLLEGDWHRMEARHDPQVEFDGSIHNVHVRCNPNDDGSAPDTEHSYTLANGRVVHNFNTF